MYNSLYRSSKIHPLGELLYTKELTNVIKQTLLKFKLKRTDEKLTPHAGATFYTEFMGAFGIKKLIQKFMPPPGSNRGYDAWQYIHPIVLMLLAGGRHIDDLREIAEDKALKEAVGIKEIPHALQ